MGCSQLLPGVPWSFSVEDGIEKCDLELGVLTVTGFSMLAISVDTACTHVTYVRLRLVMPTHETHM